MEGRAGGREGGRGSQDALTLPLCYRVRLTEVPATMEERATVTCTFTRENV